MCGICGIIQGNLNVEAKKVIVQEMIGLMSHRGPDDEGYYVDERVALGNRRLSIIDLNHGHQPMFNEDNSLVIVYNGEIYNYQELREHLIKRGHVFKSNSDTEVIIHLYEEYGPECLKSLNGMFAFAIWDIHKQMLFIARDRFGIKPLYYYKNSNLLIFSSEVKAILCHPHVKKEINFEAMDYYFIFRYIPAPHTMFKNLFKLRPGHYILLKEDGSFHEHEYWDVTFNQSDVIFDSENGSIDAFRKEFERSVRQRLVSDVPVGALLSGGIDSSAIVAAASQNLDKRLKTFSIGFKSNPEYNELKYAEIISNRFNTEHYSMEVDYDQFLDGVEKYVYFVEEPMSGPASILLYYITALASNYVKVLLSGEGSDEILGGYDTWKEFGYYRKNKIFRRIPSAVRNKLIKPLNELFFESEKIERYLRAANKPLNYHPMFFINDNSRGPSFSLQDRKKLFCSDMVNHIPLKTKTQVLSELFLRALNYEWLDQLLYVDMKYWLSDSLLLRADKMSMANSIELRVPFLDHKFVEFVNSLPSDLKLRKKGRKYTTKFILRRAFKEVLPECILDRPKKGFPVPLDRMLNGELKIRLNDYLNTPRLSKSLMLNEKYIKSLLKDYELGIEKDTKLEKRLWSIYVLFEWQNVFGKIGNK